MPLLEGISPKVNLVARLEIKLAYYDVAVHEDSLSSNMMSNSTKRVRIWG